MLRLFLASFLPSLFALVALPAFAFSPAAAPALRPALQQEKPAATVTIKGGSFAPAAVTIKAGQTVRWDNKDDRDYSIVADDKENAGFRSGTLKPGKSWSHAFEEAGTFKYHCSLRPRAKGTVRVE